MAMQWFFWQSHSFGSWDFSKNKGQCRCQTMCQWFCRLGIRVLHQRWCCTTSPDARDVNHLIDRRAVLLGRGGRGRRVWCCPGWQWQRKYDCTVRVTQMTAFLAEAARPNNMGLTSIYLSFSSSLLASSARDIRVSCPSFCSLSYASFALFTYSNQLELIGKYVAPISRVPANVTEWGNLQRTSPCGTDCLPPFQQLGPFFAPTTRASPLSNIFRTPQPERRRGMRYSAEIFIFWCGPETNVFYSDDKSGKFKHISWTGGRCGGRTQRRRHTSVLAPLIFAAT